MLFLTITSPSPDAPDIAARARAQRRKRALFPVLLLALLIAIAHSYYRQAQRQTAETHARRLLHTLEFAENQYRQAHQSYASLDTLYNAGMSPVREGAERAGYTFRSRSGRDTYALTATPRQAGWAPLHAASSPVTSKPADAQATPNGAQTWLRRAHKHATTGNSLEALRAARKAAQLDRATAVSLLYDALVNRATALQRQGAAAQALPLLREAMTLGLNDPEAQAIIGDIYQRQGKQKAAERAYRQAIGIGAANARAWFGLAKLQEARGEKKEAAASYLRVIDIGAEAYARDEWITASWKALRRLGVRAPR